MKHHCKDCGNQIHQARARLGYAVCLQCGEEIARRVKHTIAPINKSAYMLITNTELLKQLNPKRTT
jgi:ribosomal protein L37AE/L43A